MSGVPESQSGQNVGVAGDPEAQGYELVVDKDGTPFDPFGDGTRIYGCPLCEATWNADDLHSYRCPRRFIGLDEVKP